MQMFTTRIIRPAIIAAAVLAVAAPAAQARPFNGAGGSAATVHPANGVDRTGITPSHNGVIPGGRGRMTVVQPTTPTVVVHTKTINAFNWTDAALGAASGLAATLIAFAGAMALRGRRRMALSS